ncbi:MAG TPA: hypothetical protein DD391_05410 [Clostridiales bacterium]|jgi:hypothetical protein|nr:hypothetical protein [Clostridiales bacterium]
MSRLIDADKLYDYISDVFAEFGHEVMNVKDALEAVENAPTVNAIELPCKVGDTVYLKKEYIDCPNDFENCEKFDFCDDACFMCSKAITRYSVQNVQFDLTMYYDIGKTVFLTREEAEQALRERGLK